MITLEVLINNEEMGIDIPGTMYLNEGYISAVVEYDDFLLVEYNGAWHKTKEMKRLNELIGYIDGSINFEFNPDIEER